MGPVPHWCSVLPTAQARELAAAIDDAGASLLEPDFIEYDFLPVGEHWVIGIDFNPVFPDRAPN